MTEDVTDNEVDVSQRWHVARQQRETELARLEGAETFAGQPPIGPGAVPPNSPNPMQASSPAPMPGDVPPATANNGNLVSGLAAQQEGLDEADLQAAADEIVIEADVILIGKRLLSLSEHAAILIYNL